MKILRVSNKYSDKKMKTYANTFVSKSQIDQIINENMDVYTEDGKLLAKFRKKVLPPKALKQFYDATYLFTSKAITANRGDATGSKQRSLRTNPRVRSAILGYFDRWGPKQKFQFRKAGVKPPLEVRETRFSQEQPDNFKKTFPLVQRIHDQYKKVVPSHFKRQNKKARQTPFIIPKTAFTTITTNINFQTAIHKDSGDDEEGFGNLAVIERGSYEGGETCLPQYGIGFNVREGDILFMDVHEWHGNLPLVKKDSDAIRMSVVCYLRTKVWERSKNKSLKMKQTHLNTLKRIKKNQGKYTRKRF